MANTIDPTTTRPNRTTRRSKPSALGAFLALQLALGLAVLQMKLMPNYIGKCGMGHDMFRCETCKGAGQCQNDVTCCNGIRCTGGCTNL